MSRAVGPGRSSLEGLKWLASVGPAPRDAWSAAMGWATSTTLSHALRLMGTGLVATCSMRRGHGSLFYATRLGVRATGILATAPVAEPAPSTWAHWCGCGWTAAWLTSRGRHVIGSRELRLDDAWHDELEWRERDAIRRRGHHPDLAGALSSEGRWLPIEVELASKSTNRLVSILRLHANWIAARKTDAVMYVCASHAGAQRVRRLSKDAGLSVESRTLRVETLGAIRRQALAAAGLQRRQAIATLRVAS
jgi:hypothetical protein